MATKSEEQEYIDSNIVELSDRNFQIIKRSFEVYIFQYQDFIKSLFDLDKNDLEEYLQDELTKDGWVLKSSKSLKNPFYLHLIMSSRNNLEDNCGELSYKTLNHTINISCFIFVNNKMVFSSSVPLEELCDVKPDEYATYIENLFSKTFENLKRFYELCKCGDICFSSRKQCEDCYIKNFVNEENCSICFENNYRWGLLKCGHTFHLDCLQKIEPCSSTTKKCPLCRVESDLCDVYEQ